MKFYTVIIAVNLTQLFCEKTSTVGPLSIHALLLPFFLVVDNGI